MSHFDTNMMAMIGLMLFMGVFVITFLKEAILPLLGLLLVAVMIWGDDMCSRNDRIAFYAEHFVRGGEVICKDDQSHPILISHDRGWQLKGGYFFKHSQGVDILEDQCEILNRSEPHCLAISTQILIGSTAAMGMLGWMFWVFRRLNEPLSKTKEREERKANIAKAAQEMAPLYKTDPELKEWNEFVGDHFEAMEEYTQEDHHVKKNV